MAFLGLYLIGVSIGLFIGAYELGASKEIDPMLKPQIVLLYCIIAVGVFIEVRSANSNGVGMVNAEALKPYLPYSSELAKALWVAAMISVENFILAYMLIPPVILWIGSGSYPAAILQAIMIVPTCIFAGSIVRYLIYSAELELDLKKKLFRQASYGIFTIVLVAGAVVVIQAIPAYFAGNTAQKYQAILGIIQSPAYFYGISLIGAIPGLGIILIPIAILTHNWVALAVALGFCLLYGAIYRKKWQILVRQHMWGENHVTKSIAKAGKSSEKPGGRKLAKTLWPGEKIAKIFLKNPATRVHFSRQLIYQRRDPRAMIVLALPLYLMVIFGAMAYFQTSFYGIHTPYGKVQALLFSCAIACVTIYQCRWYLDSTAYWYQIIAALPGKEDIKSRLLLSSLTTVPLFLGMSTLLQYLFQITGIDILYTYVNTILAISVCLTIGFLFSSFFANPGPAPGQGITNNSLSGSGRSMLLQMAIVFLAMGVGAVILLGVFLATAAITYFTGGYITLVLALRLAFSAVLIWATVEVCGRLIDKNQVKLLQVVASWPKHTYHA